MAPKRVAKKSTLVADGKVANEREAPVVEDSEVAVEDKELAVGDKELAVEVPMPKRRRTKPVATIAADGAAAVGEVVEGDVVEEAVTKEDEKPKKKRKSGPKVSTAAEEDATPQTNRKLDMDAAMSEPKQPAPLKIAKATAKKHPLKQTLTPTMTPTANVPPTTPLPTLAASEASTIPGTLEELAALGLVGPPLPSSTVSPGSDSRAAQNEIKTNKS